MSEILDYQAQHHLRSYIRKAGLHKELKNLLYCGQSITPRTGVVYVMADDEGHAHFHGAAFCKNPFCCPVCSAKMMEKYRERIAAAIKIMKPTHFGMLVTFALPHMGFMTWRETMDILYEAHTYFRKRSFTRSHGHDMHEFHKLYPVEHNVKVSEFTWSKKNGAHPHFHCIWWIPRDKFDNKAILDWELRLDAFWLKTTKRITLAYWKKNNLHQDILCEGETLERLLERLYNNSRNAQERGDNYGLYFSKDKDGNLLEAENGDYIAGWGADNELTGNYQKKASHEGHMTPYQILLAAQHDKELRQVYLDYCLAVTRKPVHHRVRFSFTGISKLIDAYLKEERVRESERLEKKSSWEVVTYFDEEQWYTLCDLDDLYAPILSNILWFAAYRRDLLVDYLRSLGVQYNFERHRRQHEVEEDYHIVS